MLSLAWRFGKKQNTKIQNAQYLELILLRLLPRPQYCYTVWCSDWCVQQKLNPLLCFIFFLRITSPWLKLMMIKIDDQYPDEWNDNIYPDNLLINKTHVHRVGVGRYKLWDLFNQLIGKNNTTTRLKTIINNEFFIMNLKLEKNTQIVFLDLCLSWSIFTKFQAQQKMQYCD